MMPWVLRAAPSVTTAEQHRSILLLQKQNHQSATAACATFDETLLPVNETFFSSEVAPVLQYQIFLQEFTSSQLFWIASLSGDCRSIDVTGRVVSVPCATDLPVLCTQSAGPTASPEASFLVQTVSDDLTITGCVNSSLLVSYLIVL